MANFQSEDKGTWFWFDETDHKKGGVCLRVLSADRYEDIERITTKTKKKVKRGVAYDDITTDEKLASKLRWDFCIVDWKNVEVDGASVPCDKDNKTRLMKIIDFMAFVGDCLEVLTETNKSVDEARLGNSSDTSDGKIEK